MSPLTDRNDRFSVLSYTLTSDIPTLSYTWSLKKVPPSGGTSLYNPLYGVPPGEVTYHWPFIELFLSVKLSRVMESYVFNYSFLFGLLFQVQYSSCSRKMFHLLISSSHKRLLCLPMSPCFPLRLSKKWGATVKIIFMIIFNSLYLQFIFPKNGLCNFVIIFCPSFFQILPNLKEKQRYKFFCYFFFLYAAFYLSGPGCCWISSFINPWKDGVEVMNIWKSYMWTAGWKIIWNGRSSQL